MIIEIKGLHPDVRVTMTIEEFNRINCDKVKELFTQYDCDNSHEYISIGATEVEPLNSNDAEESINEDSDTESVHLEPISAKDLNTMLSEGGLQLPWSDNYEMFTSTMDRRIPNDRAVGNIVRNNIADRLGGQESLFKELIRLLATSSTRDIFLNKIIVMFKSELDKDSNSDNVKTIMAARICNMITDCARDAKIKFFEHIC